jgi:ketosteroid isomerase-like protein
MANTRIETLRAGYGAFNRRDVENALQMLDPHVEWPDMLEGRVLGGVPAVREYWTRQFGLIDSQVEPEEFVEQGACVLAVVHQRVRRLSTGAQDDRRVGHLFTFRDTKVVRMQVYADLEEARRVLRGEPEP